MTELQASQRLDIDIDDESFKRLALIAEDRFGIHLPPSKKKLTSSRISRALPSSKAKNLDEYARILEKGADANEIEKFISAITTNVTSFFREEHHFEILKSSIATKMDQLIGRTENLRVWSAGCASGEEAFSIAMTLESALPTRELERVRVLGTDIDPEMIKKAQIARYNKRKIDSPSLDFYGYVIDTPYDESAIEVSDQIRKLVCFAELNLLTEWPFKKKFAIIFCRNVAIYFRQETQEILWHRLSEQLIDGGYLFIGHSERVSGKASKSLELIDVTTYVKHKSL